MTIKIKKFKTFENQTIDKKYSTGWLVKVNVDSDPIIVIADNITQLDEKLTEYGISNYEIESSNLDVII